MNPDTSVPAHAGEYILIDAVCPLVMEHPQYIDWYRNGGASVIAPTVGSTEGAQVVMARLGAWHRLLATRDDLHLVRKLADIAEASAMGRLGIYFHIQGTDPLEGNLDLIGIYKALGVGMIQLTYNERNRVGDGCEERNAGGLSRFGLKVVDRLNEANVIVDCSHTSERTALDAIQRSSQPVVLSHSNVAAIHPSPRNVSHELIKAIAATGGVIGVVGFPGMVSSNARPSLDDFIGHIDALVELVGASHVGLGLDYYAGQAGVAPDEEAADSYRSNIASGIWTEAYPPPPHYYPSSIETPSTLFNLTDGLLQRGYAIDDVRLILGGSWMRVMERVWG